MPSYIVKPKPDEDFYVVYSTVVDSVTAFGARAEFEKDPNPALSDLSRLTRADTTGTSALWGMPPFLGWDDTEIQVREGVDDPTKPEVPAFGYVKRSDLRAFCATLQDDGKFHPPAGMIRWELCDV